METLFIYLIKSSGLIALFYLAYFILFRKETFFNSNRWFLLAGLITSVLLPLLVFTKIVWVDPSKTNFDWSNIPMTNTTIENKGFEINWHYVFTIVYAIGILLFLIKFAFDFYSLSKVLKSKTIQHQADFKFIDVTQNIAPFSYFNFIVYNSSQYSKTELENILEHEKVHSTQNHTADVLLSRLFCIVFWFNPLVWFYKNAIFQNLEFIADREASKNISDKKAYQLTLLKITTQENCVAITNHFYQSLIKKRIVMLNKNQSKKSNSWKYATIIPALVAFVLLFQIKIVAQEKTPVKHENKTVITNQTKAVNKDNNSNAVIPTEDEISKLDTKSIDKVDVTFSNNTVSINPKIDKAMIIIDGSRTNSNLKIEDIPTDQIKSLNVIKGKTAEKKYGSDGKNGVIEITTKNGKFTINKTQNNINNSMIIINEKKAGNEIGMGDINEKAIKSINVLKGKMALDKYGKEGENGVIEIITDRPDQIIMKVAADQRMDSTVNEEKNQKKEVNGWKVSSEQIKEGIKQDGTNQNNIDYKKVVIIIDGKISNDRKLKKLDPKEIVTIKVQKFKDASQKIKDEKIKEYGQKAVNGIIEVETKTVFK